MDGLWTGLYLAMLLFGGGFLLVQLVMGQLGGDHGGFEHGHELGHGDGAAGHDAHSGHDGDHHSDHGDEAKLSYLMPLVVTPALASTGAAGLIFSLALAFPPVVHLALALGIGAVVYLTMRTLLTGMMRLQGSSDLRVERLWGTVAEVTTPIPANRVGEIRYISHGSYNTSPARTVDGEALPRGQTVLIERIENSIAIVRASNI